MVVLRQKEQIQIWSPNAGFLNIHMKSMPTLASSRTQSTGPLTKTYTLSSTVSSQPNSASSNPIYAGLACVLPACPEWCVDGSRLTHGESMEAASVALPTKETAEICYKPTQERALASQRWPHY